MPAPFCTATQLRIETIRPVLEHIGLWTPVAEELVLATSAHESQGFRYRRQVGGGPALGLWQMEPATRIDIYENYLRYNSVLAEKINGLAGVGTGGSKDYDDALENNDAYACALCRVAYARHERNFPLPDLADDIPALGAYWKRWYNSKSGAGTVDQFVADYGRYVMPVA